MRYVARISPPPNPLQTCGYGNTMPAVRAWAFAMLSSAPAGTVATVYELVELARETMTKVKGKEGGKDEIIETLVGDGSVAGERTAAGESLSGDAGAAGEKQSGK